MKQIFTGAIWGIVLGGIISIIAAMYSPWVDHGGFKVFIFIGFVLGASIPIIGIWMDEERKRKEESAMHDARQEMIRSQLAKLTQNSQDMVDELPHLLRTADSAIDKAEDEFKEGVIPGFWDAIEQATNSLAKFESNIQRLTYNSNEHRDKGQKLDSDAPSFQVSVKALPDPSHIAKRFRTVVRQAQKNFQFVSIYEHRKTNKLLVSGFSSLGQAIGELGDRLDCSLQELSSSLGQNASDVREQMQQDSETRQEHEKEVRGMLDNIQHRRKPK